MLRFNSGRNAGERSDAISVLSLSTISITEEANRFALPEAMVRAQEDDEISCWVYFMLIIRMRRSQLNAWKYFLETVPSRKKRLPLAIVSAA